MNLHIVIFLNVLLVWVKKMFELLEMVNKIADELILLGILKVEDKDPETSFSEYVYSKYTKTCENSD